MAKRLTLEEVRRRADAKMAAISRQSSREYIAHELIEAAMKIKRGKGVDDMSAVVTINKALSVLAKLPNAAPTPEATPKS